MSEHRGSGRLLHSVYSLGRQYPRRRPCIQVSNEKEPHCIIKACRYFEVAFPGCCSQSPSVLADVVVKVPFGLASISYAKFNPLKVIYHHFLLLSWSVLLHETRPLLHDLALEMYRPTRICLPFVAVLLLGRVAARIAMRLAVVEKRERPQIDQL